MWGHLAANESICYGEESINNIRLLFVDSPSGRIDQEDYCRDTFHNLLISPPSELETILSR